MTLRAARSGAGAPPPGPRGPAPVTMLGWCPNCVCRGPAPFEGRPARGRGADPGRGEGASGGHGALGRRSFPMIEISRVRTGRGARGPQPATEATTRLGRYERGERASVVVHAALVGVGLLGAELLEGVLGHGLGLLVGLLGGELLDVVPGDGAAGLRVARGGGMGRGRSRARRGWRPGRGGPRVGERPWGWCVGSPSRRWSTRPGPQRWRRRSSCRGPRTAWDDTGGDVQAQGTVGATRAGNAGLPDTHHPRRSHSTGTKNGIRRRERILYGVKSYNAWPVQRGGALAPGAGEGESYRGQKHWRHGRRARHAPGHRDHFGSRRSTSPRGR